MGKDANSRDHGSQWGDGDPARELERFEAIINSFSDMVTIIDSDGTIVYVSPAVQDILGYHPDELRGEDGFQYQPQETAETVEEAIKYVIEHPDESRTVRTRFRSADESWVWIESTIQNRLDDELIEGVLVNSRDITERKERKEHLETYRLLFEATNDCVVRIESVDGEPLVRDVNEAFEETFGYDREKLVGESIDDFIVPDGFEDEAQRLNQRVVAEEYLEAEVTRMAADGLREFLLRSAYYEENAGYILYTDITKRKEREEHLETYRLLFEETNDCIVRIESMDSDPIVRDVNEAFEETFGYDREDLVGESVDDFIVPDSFEDEAQRLNQRVVEEDYLEAEVTRMAADGLRDFLLRSAYYDQDAGYILYTDITERKEREQEIKHLKNRLELAIEGANLGVWDWDMETDEVTRHVNLREILGYSAAEFGTDLSDWDQLVHSEGKSKHDEALREHIENRSEYYECDYRLRAKSGDWKWIRNIGKVVEWAAEGSPKRAVGIHIDIDERKENERALERQRDNLEVLNQVVRHDIRNNLQLVLAYAQTLEEHVEEGGKEYVRQVLEAARNAVDITETARDVAEILLQQQTERSPVDLKRVLEHEIEDVRSGNERALVTVEGTIPSVEVLADDMLESVFRNLLSNAIIHNDKNVPEVTVSASVNDEVAKIRIADNGPGIPDDQKDQIFEEGETGIDSGGTGLGLYLVQTLVDRYGGQVWIENSNPDGSVFLVELPTMN